MVVGNVNYKSLSGLHVLHPYINFFLVIRIWCGSSQHVLQFHGFSLPFLVSLKLVPTVTVYGFCSPMQQGGEGFQLYNICFHLLVGTLQPPVLTFIPLPETREFGKMWYLNNDVEPFENKCVLFVQGIDYGEGNCFSKSCHRYRLLKKMKTCSR